MTKPKTQGELALPGLTNTFTIRIDPPYLPILEAIHATQPLAKKASIIKAAAHIGLKAIQTELLKERPDLSSLL